MHTPPDGTAAVAGLAGPRRAGPPPLAPRPIPPSLPPSAPPTRPPRMQAWKRSPVGLRPTYQALRPLA